MVGLSLFCVPELTFVISYTLPTYSNNDFISQQTYSVVLCALRVRKGKLHNSWISWNLNSALDLFFFSWVRGVVWLFGLFFLFNICSAELWDSAVSPYSILLQDPMHHINVLVMLLCSSQSSSNSRALGVLKSSWYLLLCEDLGTLLSGHTLLEEKGMKPREPLVCWGIFVDLDFSQSCRPPSRQCLVSGQYLYQALYTEACCSYYTPDSLSQS